MDATCPVSTTVHTILEKYFQDGVLIEVATNYREIHVRVDESSFVFDLPGRITDLLVALDNFNLDKSLLLGANFGDTVSLINRSPTGPPAKIVNI